MFLTMMSMARVKLWNAEETTVDADSFLAVAKCVSKLLLPSITGDRMRPASSTLWLSLGEPMILWLPSWLEPAQY